MKEEHEFRLGLACIPGAWERLLDFGVGEVVIQVMDLERLWRKR